MDIILIVSPTSSFNGGIPLVLIMGNNNSPRTYQPPGLGKEYIPKYGPPKAKLFLAN